MSLQLESALEAFLNNQSETLWSRAVAELLPQIHEVDRTATEIWFRFFPLHLHRALEQADNPEQLARRLLLQGNYRLATQIDTSHEFLYGHRYWPVVKRAVIGYPELYLATTANRTLAEHISKIAKRVAAKTKIDRSLLLGITAVAVMTLQQVGFERFKAGTGEIKSDRAQSGKTPDQILRQRAREDNQGLFGFLKTANKTWTVTFDEYDGSARFKMIEAQEIASAAATDTRDYSRVDERRHEGPIPVQCRSAACGTCWVGVLGGAEKLSPVGAREAKQIKEFGYINTDETKPIIRLACQAQGHGAISIVIPPWNGVFGKALRDEKANTPAKAQDDSSSSSGGGGDSRGSNANQDQALSLE